MTSPGVTAREQRGEGGFTLLEMLVMLAVLGLMVGLVVARGPMRSAGLDARMAANQLAGTLRAARSQAIAADQPVAVAIDAASGLVQVGSATPRAIGAAVSGLARPLVFLPDGSSRGAAVIVASGPVRMRVTVDWLTGRVSIANAS